VSVLMLSFTIRLFGQQFCEHELNWNDVITSALTECRCVPFSTPTSYWLSNRPASFTSHDLSSTSLLQDMSQQLGHILPTHYTVT